MKSLSSTNAQHHFCFQLHVQAMQAAANAAASTASGVAAGAAAGAAAAAAQAGMYETSAFADQCSKTLTQTSFQTLPNSIQGLRQLLPEQLNQRGLLVSRNKYFVLLLGNNITS